MTIKSAQIPSVFAYNDFRVYLADYQSAKQKTDPLFTKSEFSRMLGLPRTRSYFFDVVRGKRVTPVFLERFISVMKLSHDESLFFRTLVLFNQASTIEERELYFDHLIRLNRTPKRMLNTAAIEYYRNATHGIIRALLAIHDFDSDFKKLGAFVEPPISAKKARESITLLKKLELIAPNNEGILKPTDSAIVAPSALQNEMILNLQCAILDRTKAAVLSNKKQQIVATNTISISDEGFKRIQKHIEKFRSELRAIIHKDEHRPSRICQFVVGFYPISKQE